MNTLLGVMLLGHAFANFVEFLGAWRLSPEAPYPDTVLAGRLHLGNGTIKLIGAVWMVLAAALAVAGMGALAMMPGWSMLALFAAACSTLMCLLEWPETKFGLGVNALILVSLLVAQWGNLGFLQL
ncbi:MAG: hypothetical protein WBV82_11555 [Myxococcaceae bacterium]